MPRPRSTILLPNQICPKEDTVSAVSFSSFQENLIKTFQIEGMIALITKMTLIFFVRPVKWPKIAVKKSQNFQKL